MEKIFEVKCKHCGRNQQTLVRRASPVGVVKKCYYCERSFQIHHHPGKTQIIRRIK